MAAYNDDSYYHVITDFFEFDNNTDSYYRVEEYYHGYDNSDVDSDVDVGDVAIQELAPGYVDMAMLGDHESDADYTFYAQITNP